MCGSNRLYWFGADGMVRATNHAGTWVDVGTPEAYLQANLAVLDGDVPVPLNPWDFGERGDGGVFVGRDARIEGSVRHSVVGEGAVIPSGTTLSDCVVWDGVEVPVGDFHRCIFYDEGGILSLSDTAST